MNARRGWVVGIGAAATVALALLAWRQAWVCDDALISFRYVKNWVGGRGLVFNPGEHIEGFSSPLLVLVLAPLEALGADLFSAAMLIGVVASLAEAALLVWLLARRGAPLVAIVVAAGGFATDRIVVVWATGGLETALHGALLLGLIALQLERPRALRTLAVGHVVLAASRPEGAAFFAIWLAHLALRPGGLGDVRRALNWFLPLVVALLAVRFLYYGELLPNPWRAKVAGVPTLAVGARHTLWFLRRMGLWGLPALALLPLAACRPRPTGADQLRAPLVLAAASVALEIALVIAMGGDYMCDFRFFRPVLGAFYLALGCLVGLAWQRRGRWWALAAAAALLGGHAWRQLHPAPIFADAPPPAEHKRILSIARERPVAFAAALARFAEPGDALLTDWTGYMGYRHDLRTVDCTGLLSAHLGRDFYLRDERAASGARERLPGHARWPRVATLERERFTFIFPKLNQRPPEDPEVTAAMPLRTRQYPFLHVTVTLEDGRYLRFFTTLGADQIAARARAHEVTACWRPGFGALTCAGPAR